VPTYQPTVITAPAERRAAVLAAWRARTESAGAVALGLHFEGPMLSPVRRGAHPVEHLLAPSLGAIEGWSAEAGVALVTLAPELPGALEVIAALRERGVVVSIGHTDCSAAEFQAARAAGATYVTHLFNAMRPFAHRDPGPIGAALADSWAVTGLIADGVHVDPVAVAMAFRSRGPDRLTLVTDAVAAMSVGSQESEARLGGVEVAVGDGEVRTAGGVLAGSVCPLDQAVRNLVAWVECGVPSAVRTVTATPARLLGRKDLGAIEPGVRADLVVLDADAHVQATIVGGEVVWRS
jgi:N-acetylglucosamine-6-phosphate deacetylase